MRLAVTALALAALAGPALAAEGGEKDKKIGQYVELSPVALPVVVDGELINYVFVHTRINLTAMADSPKLREKEPYFRDALVRAGHRTPFTRPDDYTKIDEAKLRAALLREAAAIAGARNVSSVVVISQTPKQRTGLPRPRTADAG